MTPDQQDDSLRSVLDTAPVLIALLDSVNQGAWFNRTWLEFTGQTQEASQGDGWQERIHPDDREAFQAASSAAAPAKTSFSVKHRFQRQDGEYRWMLHNAAPRIALDGTLSGFTSSCTDITEEHEAQEKQKIIIGSITDGLAVLDSNYRFSYLNEKGAQMIGMRPEDLLGQSAWDMFPYARERRFFEEFEIAMLGGRPVEFEEYYPEPLNMWLECRCFPAVDGLSVYFRDITERKRTEAALKESNERFHLLADAMPQLAWMARSDGYVYWYNQRWFEYTGTTLEQMEGWGWQAVHDPLQLPQVLERWKASVAQGHPFDMTFSIRGKDGILRPFLTRGFPLTDRTGEVLQWFGTCTDVSELKAAEQLFRVTFENAAVGIAHVAPDGHWLRVNEAVCTLIGYDRPELFTLTSQEITHPDDLARDLAMAWRLHTNQADSYNIEKRCIRKDGSLVWVNVTVSCARLPNGDVEYFIALVEDITERKEQQAALERSEARLRRVLESNVVGMIRWNLDTSLILEANDEFYRMTGYSAEDIAAGLNFRNLTPEEWTTRNEQGIFSLRNQGFATPYEKEYIRKDGSRVAIIIAGTRFEDSPSEGISFLIDISERKKQQQEIQDLNTRLQRSIAESHHRIKNNLQILSAMVEVQSTQLDGSVPKEKWTRLSTHIRTLASLHEMLTLEVRDIASLDTIDLATALDKLLPIMMLAMGGQEIRYEVDQGIRLPLKQSSSFLLLVNELIANAHKHGQGEILLLLKQVEKDRPYAHLEVCDHGPGFPAGFTPEQAANTGLELIESLGVWDLGGNVRYENRPEGGARVIVTFPLLLS